MQLRPPFLGRPSRAALFFSGGHLGLGREQRDCDLGVTAGASVVQWRGLVLIAGVDAGAPGGSKGGGKGGCRVASGCNQPSCVFLLASMFMRAPSNQLFNHRLLPVQAGDVQRSVAVLPLLINAHLRADRCGCEFPLRIVFVPLLSFSFRFFPLQRRIAVLSLLIHAHLRSGRCGRRRPQPPSGILFRSPPERVESGRLRHLRHGARVKPGPAKPVF
jgi:hypothetical protein